MSNRYAFRIGAIVLVTVLTGCPQPEATTPVDATLDADALVFAGTAGESPSWSARIEIDDAPAGEYLLFASRERPTSLAGLAGLDLSRCGRVACDDVPGLGTLGRRVTLDAPGTVKLDARSDYGEYPSSFFFVAVRRGSATNDRLNVKGWIGIGEGGACSGDPDPPSVVTSSLDGAPPIPEPAGGDAGAGPDASTMTAPTCEALQAQVDACTTLSQKSKDTFATFCSGISSSCRGCLDGVLCGVTEQCDPLCGK